ncbi:MAG: efflux RND transporter periplasmic adaptor subunit [Planctomycetota bacterium]
MAQSLVAIGDFMDGVYMTLHARLGGTLFTEEWVWEGFEAVDAMRDAVTEAMTGAMTHEKARCVRIGTVEDMAPAILTMPIYDADYELTGAVAVVIGPCGRDKASAVLSLYEGIIGYLTLVASEPVGRVQGASTDEGLFIPKDAQTAAHDPLFLAYAMAARLKNQYALDQVVVGFVRGLRVKVVAVCGLDEVRASNPGIKLVQGAMEECLDRDGPVVCHGQRLASKDGDVRDDFRLHTQWSRSVGGDSVGSFPVKAGDKTIAIVSLRVSSTLGLHEDNLASYASELEAYSALMSVARNASRDLVSHTGAVVRKGLQKVYGREDWKGYTWLTVAGLLLLWLLFGTVSYSLTVPCSVTSADPRVVSSPREGILERLLVRPGDRVKKNQLLAAIDVEAEILERARLRAELKRIGAAWDRALAEADPAEGKVLGAQREAVLAELDMVKMRIQRSEIRAAEDGIILQGDLRKRVGSKLSIGEPLFHIATDGQVTVELRIPEHRIWDGREALAVVFAPHARPHDRITLTGLPVAPSSTVRQGKNVFIAESTAFAAPDHLSPGMEGVAHLEIGERSVWWVMTHRITDWLRLQFWM